VDVHGPGDRPDRAGTGAEAADGVERPLAQLRVRGQPEVVVRGKIDDLPVIERRRVALLALENAELAEQPELSQRVKFRSRKARGSERISRSLQSSVVSR
jgi:hypothetical protein